MKKYVLILLVFFPAIFAHAQSVAEGSDMNLENNDNFSGFAMIGDQARNARVVMTGENHTYVTFNTLLEVKMLRYLNKTNGTRNFLIELGPARAHFVNRYIQGRDTQAERFLKSTTSPKYMKLFRKLRAFNETLPDSAKVRVWGIDVERFNDLPLMRLSELLPNENIPASIRVSVDAIKGTAAFLNYNGLRDYKKALDNSSENSDPDDMERVPFYINPSIRDFVKHYDSLKNDFISWLGPKYSEVNEAVVWVREYLQWRDYEKTTFQYVWREENIYQNLVQVLDGNPGERFYGQFGRCHVAYNEQNGDCGWYAYHSVINKLRSRYKKDSILSIGILYDGYYDNSSYYKESEEELYKVQKEISAVIAKSRAGNVTIFDLNHKYSDLPQLKKKFTYAIVNKYYKSVEADTFDVEDKPLTTAILPNRDKFKLMLGLGMMFTGDKGPQMSVSPRPINISANLIFPSKYILGMNYMLARNIDVGVSDSITTKSTYYNMDLGGLNLGRKLNRFIHVGGSAFFSNQSIVYKVPSTSIFAGDRDRIWQRKSFVFGPYANIYIHVAKSLYINLEARYMFDLQSGTWHYKDTKLPYEPFQSNMGGYYFGINVAGLIQLEPQYSNNRYD